MNRKQIGNFYEDVAIDYLRRKKYKILDRNYKTKFGELDIIAYDKMENCYVFVEVRYRTNLSYGTPQETVNYYKQRRIILASMVYIKRNKLKNVNLRFDIIAIDSKNNVEHIINAFQTDNRDYVYY
ncbi:MAG: YraN family protein [Endomicrobia bacterium]|nr:YraN family protein [Endomicrobiia bacterium]MCX7940778.1 YraN family protein [Endomicrobiia bacterium]MDW8055606.1 YraN family protein [Elusimicrobiota bacterium]